MPPEIHFLVPLMVHVLPSSLLVAVVLSPATSEPANASEMASEMTFRKSAKARSRSYEG